MKRYFVLVFIGLVAGLIIGQIYPKYQSFEERRENTIQDMESVIQEKVDEGEYRCCIEPGCDMCFLGHWLWDDGICRCDDMIAAGEDDKVCPQCKKAIEQGFCKRSSENACAVPGIT